MTNTEKIMFDAKYSLKYLNGKYILSAFNHLSSIHIREEDIYDILNDDKLVYFSQEEWEEFAEDYKVSTSGYLVL